MLAMHMNECQFDATRSDHIELFSVTAIIYLVGHEFRTWQ